jgi:hypothetical protein
VAGLGVISLTLIPALPASDKNRSLALLKRLPCVGWFGSNIQFLYSSAWTKWTGLLTLSPSLLYFEDT